MTVKLSRDPGTPIKYPSLHSFIERSRDPGTKTTVIFFVVTMNNNVYGMHLRLLMCNISAFVKF